MSTLLTFFFSAGCVLLALWELARCALSFGWALLMPKALLAGRVVALESQLVVEMNGSGGGKGPRRQFTPAFRLLWVGLSKLLDGWEDLVHLMKPETVKRWHTKAFELFWRWRSRPGRPPVSSEMRQLIRQISRENPLWGPDRIRDTLLLLGYEAPCTQTICKYMVKPRKPVLSKNSSATQDARRAALVVFSPLVYTPALRGAEDGGGRRTRIGLDRPAGNRHRAPAAVPYRTHTRRNPGLTQSRGGSRSRGCPWGRRRGRFGGESERQSCCEFGGTPVSLGMGQDMSAAVSRQHPFWRGRACARRSRR